MANKRSFKRSTRPGTRKDAVSLRKFVFVETYIANGGNATEAAKEAGYSPKTAASQGQRLLKDADISARISGRAKEIAEKYRMTTELVARSIIQELTFDPAKLYNDDGTLKKVTELDEDTRMALTSLEVEMAGTSDMPILVRKIKWATRGQAREQLMKHLGMFERDNQQKTPVTFNLNLVGGQ